MVSIYAWTTKADFRAFGRRSLNQPWPWSIFNKIRVIHWIWLAEIEGYQNIQRKPPKFKMAIYFGLWKMQNSGKILPEFCIVKFFMDLWGIEFSMMGKKSLRGGGRPGWGPLTSLDNPDYTPYYRGSTFLSVQTFLHCHPLKLIQIRNQLAKTLTILTFYCLWTIKWHYSPAWPST